MPVVESSSSKNGMPVERLLPSQPWESGNGRVLVACLALVAATLAFYNPIIHNQFTGFDDFSYLLKNAEVQRGLTWPTVKWSFTTFHEGNWHPVTWLSHALDCEIFGLNPVGHHYTNVLLHAGNAVLLFLLLWRATGFFWSSLSVAALFALHPVNVESVAWASERKNVLSMLFFLLALHVYDRYARTGRRSLYLWLVALFAIGLMAKPQIVTLPFVLLLWDYWPLQRIGAPTWADGSASMEPAKPRSFGYLIWEKLPLFILAAADSIVTAIAQRAGNAVRTISEFSVAARLENAIVCYVRYVAKLFWPSRLAPMYPRPQGLLPLWQVFGAAALLIFIAVIVFRWRDRRQLVIGWLWYLGTLVPMIGIMTVGDQAMADRYAYIPFIGLFVAIIWTCNAIADEYDIATTVRAGLIIVVLLILGCLTYRQIGYWRDDDTLWRYTLRVTDGNYVAHNNLALMFAKAGRSEEAMVEFRAAMALHKYPANQVLTLAFYELRVGHPQEAVDDCDAVLRTATDRKIQTVAWAESGQAFLQMRQHDQAAERYRNALRVSPDNEMAVIGFGLLALQKGQFSEALAEFNRAVKIDPSDVNLLLLGQALRRSGRTLEGDAAQIQAQKISADWSAAQNSAGELLSLVGLPPM